MARPQIKLDIKGLEEVATRDETRKAVEALAERVADNLRGQGIKVGAFKGSGKIDLPVRVTTTTTGDMRFDRAKSWVTINHPAALAVQAKYGALTRAASEAGLTVKGD